ncbi:MAG TPA: hypothetical protein VG938_06920 [Verrucomicrobiae bacterium]|nr:hypothetical protein [Verrucomicrobiae bacterium]
MRTLLTDSFPPQFADDRAFSAGAEVSQRTFSEEAVLIRVDDLLEVGADGTATAAPDASAAEETAGTLERGVAISASSCRGDETPEDAFTP